MTTPKQPKRTGPKPQTVKINVAWEKAVGGALKCKRPDDGWPDQPKPKKKKPA